MTIRARRLLISALLIPAVLACGGMVAGWLYATKPPAERTAEPAPPPLVEVVTVTRGDIPVSFVGYGSARSDRDVVITAEVSGMVVALSAGLNDGSVVTTGQILVEVDDRRYMQQVARTQAVAAELTAQIEQLNIERENIGRLIAIAEQELAVNLSELDRLGDLLERDLATKKETDFARLAYQQSQRQLQVYKNQTALIEPRRRSLEAARDARLAEAELARLDVERCRIAAPFAGQVVRLAVEVGDRVMPGSEIVEVMSTRRIEVPIELAASAHAAVAVGAQCRLEADSVPGVVWSGTLSRRAPAVDVRSRTFAAYVDVDNAAQEVPLVPGYFLQADVEGPLLRDVVAIPRGAIVGDTAYVAAGATARARAVHVDRYVEDLAVVTGEIVPGDQLIVTNLDVLHDGADVRVVPQRVVDSGSKRP